MTLFVTYMSTRSVRHPMAIEVHEHRYNDCQWMTPRTRRCLSAKVACSTSARCQSSQSSVSHLSADVTACIVTYHQCIIASRCVMCPSTDVYGRLAAFGLHVMGLTLSWNKTLYYYKGLALTGCFTDQQVWFPIDFQETFSRKFSRICSFIDIYRAGSPTLGITLMLFTQAIAQLKDIYRRLIAPISINPGNLLEIIPVDLSDTLQCMPVRLSHWWSTHAWTIEHYVTEWFRGQKFRNLEFSYRDSPRISVIFVLIYFLVLVLVLPTTK